MARRMEEREKERLKEEEQRAKELQSQALQAQASSSPREQDNIPSGLLSPILRRHQDLDNELRQRLHALEKK